VKKNMNSLLHSKYLRFLTLVVVAQAVFFYSASHGESTPLPLPLKAFPTQLGNWKLYQEGVVDDETEAVLKADDTLTRDYTSPEGGANLFIAYFKTQRTGQSPHSPKNCLPGAGFQPIEGESGHVDVPVTGGTITINKYVVAQGGDESVVLYWYQSQGRVIADEFAAKFYLVADSIRRHRSDTSLVRVVVPVIRVTREQAAKTAVDFVQASYPAINSWLPR
jgi:EpsI family protein